MQSNYFSRETDGMYRNVGPGPRPALMGADMLIGNDVYNMADEGLGTIKELVFNMRSGKINYAVLSYGGFLGMGDRLFASSVANTEARHGKQATYSQCHKRVAQERTGL
jgi:sporulation protein YlmC with PRC-barrel domain